MRRRRDCELELVGYSSSPHENFLHWRVVGRDVGNYSQLGSKARVRHIMLDMLHYLVNSKCLENVTITLS